MGTQPLQDLARSSVDTELGVGKTPTSVFLAGGGCPRVPHTLNCDIFITHECVELHREMISANLAKQGARNETGNNWRRWLCSAKPRIIDRRPLKAQVTR